MTRKHFISFCINYTAVYNTAITTCTCPCIDIWNRETTKQKSVLQSACLPKTIYCYSFTISLIPKKSKDKTILKNLRPISLLNVDYKILTKAIAKRLEKVLPKIGSPKELFICTICRTSMSFFTTLMNLK